MTVEKNIAIVGSGPSALSLALSCARLGLSTSVFSPNPFRPWRANYCFWKEELQNKEFESMIGQTWSEVTVLTSEQREKVLRRTYAQFDTARLQKHLVTACQQCGVAFVEDKIEKVNHLGDFSLLSGHKNKYVSQIAVDVTGNKGAFLKKRKGRPPAWQLAYGQHLHLTKPSDVEQLRVQLMDYRTFNGSENCEIPSFLYVLPVSADSIFVEETILTSRADISFEQLRARLECRLDRLTLGPATVQEEEFCRIKMGGPLPDLSQRMLGFGSAAGLVHPATGYQVAHAFNLAPSVAMCLAKHLPDVPNAVRESWQVIWPSSKRKVWSLYQFGMDVLCHLDQKQTQHFFNAFFSMSDNLWSSYLSSSENPSQIVKAMSSVFVHLDWSLQRRLLSSSFQPSGASLLRAISG